MVLKFPTFSMEGIRKWLRVPKNRDIVLALAAILVVLLAYRLFFPGENKLASGNSPPEAMPQSQPTERNDEEAKLEERLETILSQIRNAGEVRVLVTFASGREIVPAVSVDEQSDSASESSEGNDRQSSSATQRSVPVTVAGQNGASLMILKEMTPEILGVVVVAEGAGDILVRLELARAVQTALDIPQHRIDVFAMGTG